MTTPGQAPEASQSTPPPVIELVGVRKTYRLPRTHLRGSRPTLDAVRTVDITVPAGHTLGIVGESGSGKSTLGRMALGLLRPSAGTVRIAGEDLSGLRGRALRAARRRVQGAFQDPTSSLNPRMSIGASIAEPLRASGIRGRAARERVLELMELVGLDPRRAGERPRRFSGGQRQRVVIARALAAGPQAVVADEPVSALDVSVQAQILNLFRRLQETTGLATIFVSHDLAVIAFVADSIAVMYLGEVVETGPAGAVLDDPAHPYTKALRAAARAGDAEGAPVERAGAATTIPVGGCPFRTRCPLAMPRCESERPAMRSVGDGRQAACHALEEG